jgi:hypothetical protein
MEVTRVCTHAVRSEMTKNASSKLYSACCKKAKKLGAKKLVTYTLFEEESGHSLVASGWTPTQISSGGSWNRDSRAREDKAPTGRKVRWEKGLSKAMRKDVASRAIELEDESEEAELLEQIVNVLSQVDEGSAHSVSDVLEIDPVDAWDCMSECLELGILYPCGVDMHGDRTYAVG